MIAALTPPQAEAIAFGVCFVLVPAASAAFAAAGWAAARRRRRGGARRPFRPGPAAHRHNIARHRTPVEDPLWPALAAAAHGAPPATAAAVRRAGSAAARWCRRWSRTTARAAVGAPAALRRWRDRQLAAVADVLYGPLWIGGVA